MAPKIYEKDTGMLSKLAITAILIVITSVFVNSFVNNIYPILENNRIDNTNSLNNNEMQPLSSADPQEYDISIYFFYNNGCDICISKRSVIREFNESKNNLNYFEKKIYCGEPADETFASEFFADYPKDIPGIPNPIIVFTYQDQCKYAILEVDISSDNLETVYTQLNENPESCDGWIIFGEFSPWIAFVTGLVSGLSPCIILMTGVLGTSFFTTKERKTFLIGALGFIIGVLAAYLSMGVLFYYVFDIASAIFNSLAIKLIVGIPLLVLGAWYLIDAWNENSKLFKTPDKFKKFFKTMAGKGSIVSALLLGLAFTYIKSPCVAGIMISLLFNLSNYGPNLGMIIMSVMMFAIGVLIPILIILALMRLGISSDKINDKRKKYRPYLRLLSGLLIIGLTIWSLF